MLSLLRMKHTGIGIGEPDDGTPKSDVCVRIAVREEFLGASIQELTIRGGLLKAIEKKEELRVVSGDLPALQFAGLCEAILAFTSGRGVVELRDESPTG